MQSQLLTVNQAADFLGLSERAVFRLKDAGDLSYVKLGRSLRFNVDELNRLIEENTENTKKKPLRVTGNNGEAKTRSGKHASMRKSD